MVDKTMSKIDFWEWLFKEIGVKDVSHLNKKFDQFYMTIPVFQEWIKELIKDQNGT
jgi:hypothetical protein